MNLSKNDSHKKPHNLWKQFIVICSLVILPTWVLETGHTLIDDIIANDFAESDRLNQ